MKKIITNGPSPGPPREFWGPWGKRERRGPLASEGSRKFSVSNYGKLLLVYFIRSPDLEAFDIMRLLWPWDPVAICPYLHLGGPAHHPTKSSHFTEPSSNTERSLHIAWTSNMIMLSLKINKIQNMTHLFRVLHKTKKVRKSTKITDTDVTPAIKGSRLLAVKKMIRP